VSVDAMTARAENYATRRRIADQGLADLAEARAACGPGATAYGFWLITDKLGDHPPRRTFCCRRDGAGWLPAPDAADERIADPARAFVVKGVTYYPMRYSIAFGALVEYKPRTPDQLQRAAEARQAKRDEAERVMQAARAQERDRQLELQV
jgi:hypothetical protein